MFAEKVIELLKEAERNPETIDQFNVSFIAYYRFIFYCRNWIFVKHYETLSTLYIFARRLSLSRRI